MPTPRAEEMPQEEILLRLRYAIDTAISYPNQQNIDAAIRFAVDHPKALRAARVQNKLGQRRLDWLNEYGVYTPGEGVEIAGISGFKTTITPDITK